MQYDTMNQVYYQTKHLFTNILFTQLSHNILQMINHETS